MHQLTAEDLALAKRIIDLVDGDYYGIDLIYDGNRPVFNELEDTVGARMVYDLTDIDIIGMYCEYIKQNIKGL